MEQRRIRYIDDYHDPEMLHLTLVRSSVQRGRLNLLSYPEPPGELRIYGAQDIPGINRVELSEGAMPLLADQELAYPGQPLLIVAAPERAAAEAFADQVEIDYRTEEILPAFHAYLNNQIAAEEILSKGDPDEALENAFQVLEGSYTVNETRPWSIDTQGAFSRFEEGRLVIYSSTQWIHHVRRTVAAALKLKEREIHVRRTAYAAQFDEKLTYPSILAAYTALVTWNSGRPARLLLSPDDRLRYGPLGTPVQVFHRTALSKEGELAGIDVEVNLEAGAYPLYSREALKRAGAAAAGNYACENVRVRTRMITTNRRPLNFSPGAGIAGCFFASETHASRIAEISQSDPLEWKLDNLDGRQSPLPELLTRVAAASDFSRKHAAYELAKKRRINSGDESLLMRGIGIAGVYQGNGFFGRGEDTERFKVTVRLESEGSLYIYTSGLAGSNRTAGLARRRAAEILGINRDGVHIINDDTAQVPDSGPSGLSRNISVLFRLVERCCEAIKKRRFRNPLPLEASRSFRLPARDRWEESTMQGNPYAARSWAACVVEVELDPTLFEKRVRGVWTAVDCGEVIHRHRAESSLEIGILQALEGCGFSPDLLPEEEGLFHLPEYREIPPMSIQFNRNSRQKYASGIGDLPYIMIPPAFTAALSQASGVYFDQLPLSSRSLYRYMEEQ